MDSGKMRKILAVLILGGSLLIIAFVIIYPLLSGIIGFSGNKEIYHEYIGKSTSLFSGIIGIIIGYYFGFNK